MLQTWAIAENIPKGNKILGGLFGKSLT